MKKIIFILILFSASLAYSQVWERCDNGIYGASITSLVKKGNLLFMGTMNGLYESSDNGDDWIILSDYFQKQKVLALAVDGVRLYVGLGSTGAPNTFLYFSDDNGKTWGNFPVPNMPGINHIFIYENKIYLNFNGELLISQDTGKTWSYSFFFNQVNTVNDLKILGNKTFASDWGITSSLSQSTDDGQTWNSANGFEIGNSYKMTINSNKIFVGTDYGIYVSVDTGRTWTQVNNELANIPVWSICSSGDTMIAASLSGIFTSVDGGEHFTAKNKFIYGSFGSRNEIVTLPLIIDGNTIYAVSYNCGFYRSDDFGNSWRNSNTGLTGQGFFSTITTNNKDIYVMSNFGGLHHSTNNGDSWSEFNDGIEGACFAQVNNNSMNLFAWKNSVFYPTLLLGLYKTNDNGLNWELANKGLPGTTTYNGYVDCMAANDKTIFLGTSDNGLFISQDSGMNWEKTSLSPKAKYITSISVDKNNIFVIANFTTLFLSIDNGNNWNQLNIDTIVKSANRVWSLAAIDGNIFIGTTTGGLFLSEDMGQSWKPINNGIFNLKTPINSIIINGGTIYIGTNGNGIFTSTNNGENWSPLDSGLADSYISGMAINDNYIYATTGNSQNFPFIYRLPNDNGFKTINVRLPDTTAAIGNNNFILPIYAKLDSTENTLSNKPFTADLKWDARYFIPDSLENFPFMINETTNGIREIKFSGIAPLLNKNDNIIAKIHGKILLAPKEKIPLIISDFTLNDSNIVVNKYNGSILVSGVCVQDISLLQGFQPPQFDIAPNPAGNSLNITGTITKNSNYSISIYDNLGKRNLTETGNSSIGEVNNEIYIQDFSPGLHIVVITTDYGVWKGMFVKE